MDADFPLVSRSWNGTPISRRPADGYVNATAMCKANGRRWSDFRESDRCNEYLEALETKTGISVFALVQSRRGGLDSGTWVHPDVATELARWISAEFSVFVNQWFREEFERRAQHPAATEPQPVALLDTREQLDMIDRGFTMLERFGVVDDRDRLQFGDMVRNATARAVGGQLLAPALEELTISDAWLEVTGEHLPRKLMKKVGMAVARMYREEFQADPPKRVQYVDGAPRKVNSYQAGWLLNAVRIAWEDMRQKEAV